MRAERAIPQRGIARRVSPSTCEKGLRSRQFAAGTVVFVDANDAHGPGDITLTRNADGSDSNRSGGSITSASPSSTTSPLSILSRVPLPSGAGGG